MNTHTHTHAHNTHIAKMQRACIKHFFNAEGVRQKGTKRSRTEFTKTKIDERSEEEEPTCKRDGVRVHLPEAVEEGVLQPFPLLRLRQLRHLVREQRGVNTARETISHCEQIRHLPHFVTISLFPELPAQLCGLSHLSNY